MDTKKIPLKLKLSFIAFMALLIPVYWNNYGPSNFLWYSDIVLGLSFIAVMTESSLFASMGAVGGIFLESFWSLNFLLQLLFDFRLTRLTDYMFDHSLPLWLRLISLFHVALPPLLIWLIIRLGYNKRAWLFQILISWMVLTCTWLVTDPIKNINWVFCYKEISWLANLPLVYLFLEGMLFALILAITHQFLNPRQILKKVWVRTKKHEI